jgi:glucokinase-like ROK family protein
MNPHRGYVVGIDLGATHASLLLTDFAARVLEETEIPIDINQGPQACLAILEQHFQILLDRVNLTPSDLMAVGMGVPGPVVANAGMVSSPPIMPGWDHYPIVEHLQANWSCPVSLNNDAELGALGEWAYGAGRGERHLAYIKVGTGIGAGLLLDGRIYRGAAGCAGEIGHVTIREGGPRCTCGSQGCLEALAGGGAIARQALEAVRAGKRTQLSTIQPPESITAKSVASAARHGDLVSQQIMAEAGHYLGVAISSLVNLVNPSIVIIGGGVSLMGDLLLEPMRQAIKEKSLPSAARAVRVSTALLGKRSSGMGAVVQALNLAIQSFTEN